jgi:tetratricopeptide (TPR) repeat protein
MLGAAAPLSAQELALAAARLSVPAPDRAIELRSQAEAMLEATGPQRRAARMLERSAALRDATDPDAYSIYRLAGRVRAALGDYYGARINFTNAAEHAAARGAVFDAAHAWIDAAHAALALGQAEAVVDYAGRARLLALSPQLTTAQSNEIVRRIGR